MDYPRDQFGINQSEDGALDNEFRRILWDIKQYIPYINSNYHLSLYRIWLEKLSSADSEKVERNIYLFELARQIKDNTLLPPFNQYPPTGSLKDLPKINHFRSSDSQTPTQTTQTNSSWIDIEQPQQIPVQTTPCVEQNYYYPHQQQYQDNRTDVYYSQPTQSNPYSFSYYTEPLDRFYYNFQHGDDEEAREVSIEQPRIPPKLKKRRLRNMPRSDLPSQNIPVENGASRDFGEMPKNCAESGLVEEGPSRDMPKNDEVPSPPPKQENEAVKEDSSWCDLTEADASITSIANSFASGDGEVKESMVQQRVQTFNEYRKVFEQSATEDVNTETQNMELTNLNTEVDSANKDQNLSATKPTLKDTHFISADWKKTIEALQLRLTETLNQNNELKAIIKSLQIKMQEEAAKHKEENQRIAIDLHNQEIEALKQLQADNVKKLEKSFQTKLDEAERNYHQKIDKIKINYESKTKEMKFDHENSRKEKDREIARLTEIIQQQCTRMSNEISALRHHLENSLPNGNDEKIIVLQKCVSKMDKLFQKSEKEYQKQLEKLRQELELKDRVMQIQLKTQRAELITRTSAEKQKQFDDVINNLEIKYIKMLEYHEAQVMESRKHDEEKIERLLNLLDKNDIPCDFM